MQKRASGQQKRSGEQSHRRRSSREVVWGSNLQFVLGAATMRSMRIAAGRVVGKTVVLEGEPLPEGSRVTVYFDERDGVHVDPETRKALLESIAEADRGETRPVEELIAKLKAKKKK